MPISDILMTFTRIFTEIQVVTGLSAPAVIFMIGTCYKTISKTAKETDSVVAIIASVIFWVLFWWLVGYMVVNPLWNLLLGKL